MSDKNKCPFCGNDVAHSPLGHVWCDQCDYRIETAKFENRPLEDAIEKELENKAFDVHVMSQTLRRINAALMSTDKAAYFWGMNLADGVEVLIEAVCLQNELRDQRDQNVKELMQADGHIEKLRSALVEISGTVSERWGDSEMVAETDDPVNKSILEIFNTLEELDINAPGWFSDHSDDEPPITGSELYGPGGYYDSGAR